MSHHVMLANWTDQGCWASWGCPHKVDEGGAQLDTPIEIIDPRERRRHWSIQENALIVVAKSRRLTVAFGLAIVRWLGRRVEHGHGRFADRRLIKEERKWRSILMT